MWGPVQGKNSQEQTKQNKMYSDPQRKEMDCEESPSDIKWKNVPSDVEWKNVTHPVDRTANWCIGGCWFTLAQWMVGWTGRCLCPLPHLLYPLWIDWPRHLFTELHNWIRTFVVARKSGCMTGTHHLSATNTRKHFSGGKYYCTCLLLNLHQYSRTWFVAGCRTWMFLPQSHNTAALKQVQE
jgi:hypothetical protein